jgi:hypothetical protein
MRIAIWIPVAVVLGSYAGPARGDVIAVGPGESVQAAIDLAQDGDTVAVAAGEYPEDIDFHGKAIIVVGSGPSSVLRGSGGGPVVTFDEGETAASVLDSFTITGGHAARGGGILISGASPTILRNIVRDNRASAQGSGVYVEASTAELRNNLIVYNGTSLGDPHGVEIVSASPSIINNTIAKTDSNGLILRGSSAALVMNNVIANNGSRTREGGRRGRGICDFSGGLARIQYNLFHRNRVAALLANGTDFRRIRGAENEIAPPRLFGNVDGPARFPRRPRKESEEATIPDDFTLRQSGSSRAIDAGNPDPAFNDADGSRNDIGFTGGPFAP